MTKTTIRRAAPTDAQTLARLGRETFTATFGHLYPPADLAAFLDQTHSLAAVERELADPAMAAWLALARGTAVGYAVAGPCALPHPAVTADCGEIKRLYVQPDWQGEGAGQALFDVALAWLGSTYAGAPWIGVWSGNDRAIRFYARHGFERVGDYRFRVGATLDDEFILRRA